MTLLSAFMIASGSDDGTVRLWDVTSGESHGVLKGHRSGVTCLVALENGRVGLVSGSE
jgi:WD40 repeat protein